MGKIAENSNSFSDPAGYSTLGAISSADKFNRWMYQTIAPFFNGQILEIGGGIGNISKQVLADSKTLTITELREEYCQLLREEVGPDQNLQNIVCLDIVDLQFDSKYETMLGTFDTVFALNVIEHIENDKLAIANCKKLLKPGGQLIILVPAFQFLFNSFDRSLGHFRRYTQKSLICLFEENSLEIVHRQYFNFVGTLGWWVSGSLLRKKTVPEGQMKLYNFFVPLIRIIDYYTRRFVGLSVIVVGRKN
ncbi:MAG: methyltransferase type 12 [Bacteroidetes bacterium GWF2_42_66]|nr:MAG: methyltransferase type 12 [Bacteroidetes bacterium GWA2_42_15]OFY03572.1 MAG: methyltransferase type 12 [Bacteroidetes bacterium GWE2_42_39]OFY45937.1 MAG: methyltransferase type 12 [Bacteroidetes bacterium GWF2_42_66]HBL75179.1 class I SAM-dependent methyltransferase [Prolixibacteraceae bacterium]HCR89730.1 class I SAM-dependent methyltransferase [Prolixibacteraceae bacterium]